MGTVDAPPEVPATSCVSPVSSAADLEGCNFSMESIDEGTGQPRMSSRSILRTTSARSNGDFGLEEGREEGTPKLNKRVSFHQATVFNLKPATPKGKLRRSGNALTYWMCGGAIWVLLMGGWLFIGAWLSFKSGRHVWATVLGFLAVQLLLYGLRWLHWSVRALRRTMSNQASREKALQQWKED